MATPLTEWALNPSSLQKNTLGICASGTNPDSWWHDYTVYKLESRGVCAECSGIRSLKIPRQQFLLFKITVESRRVWPNLHTQLICRGQTATCVRQQRRSPPPPPTPPESAFTTKQITGSLDGCTVRIATIPTLVFRSFPFFCWLDFTTSLNLVSPRSDVGRCGLTPSWVIVWLTLCCSGIVCLFFI